MLNGQKVLAIVLCRSKSIGLPGKNYRSLLGVPLFLWSVMAAHKSKYVDKIVVSSCCPFVKEKWNLYCEKCNKDEKLLYRDRPEELNAPNIKNEDVLFDVLDNVGEIFDIIITLQPTSPIRPDNLLDNCLEHFDKTQCDSLLTVTRHTPFIWKKRPYPLYHNYIECPNNYYINRPMRQDIKESDFIFLDNGNIYVTRREILIKDKNRLGGDISMYETDKLQSLQIDDLIDFELIEGICQKTGKVI